MSGRLHTKGRLYPDADTRAAVEARIPDGYAIQVQPTDRWWLIYLHGANGGRVTPGPLRVSRGLPLQEALLFALDRWEKTGVAA